MDDKPKAIRELAEKYATLITNFHKLRVAHLEGALREFREICAKECDEAAVYHMLCECDAAEMCSQHIRKLGGE